MAIEFIETDERAIDLVNEQSLQAAYDEAMYDLLERSADRACMSIEILAEAVKALAAAISDQANARITDR